MKIRYLLDENIGIAMLQAVKRLDGRIDITRVGSLGAPPYGTLDPEVLLFCEREERALVTDNRHSMAKHIADHFLAGHEHWGIFEVPAYAVSVGDIADMLYLYWATTEAEDVKNGIFYIT